MHALHIRKATKEDALLLARLSAETFYETFAKDNKEEDMQQYIQAHFLPQHIEKEILEKDNCFLIAFMGDEAAGYAKLRSGHIPKTLKEKNALEIERLYVRHAFHSQKIGWALMNECIGYAKSCKATLLWLGVWEHNKKAIAFYERTGFEKFGEHDFILGNDVQNDWLMKLLL